jgi:aquaporin NIP
MDIKKYAAEFTGTFVLVFFATGAITVSSETGGLITHGQIAIIFGLCVMTMILAFNKVSGAHINPAVTIGMAVSKKMSRKNILPYIIAQIAGALLGSFLVFLAFPRNKFLGATIPTVSSMECFVIELVLTLVLMIAVLRSPKRYAAIIIGGIVAIEAFFLGKLTGASMNPARSIGPALVSGHTEFLWIYLTAPVLGAVIAVYANKLIKD